jgi:hypothetical protein
MGSRLDVFPAERPWAAGSRVLYGRGRRDANHPPLQLEEQRRNAIRILTAGRAVASAE